VILLLRMRMPQLRIKANIQMGAFIRNCHLYGSQDNIVDIATCYGLDGLGFKPQWEARFSVPVQTRWGSPSLLYSGYWISFLEVKHGVNLRLRKE
jgi:hypothetical protein